MNRLQFLFRRIVLFLLIVVVVLINFLTIQYVFRGCLIQTWGTELRREQSDVSGTAQCLDDDGTGLGWCWLVGSWDRRSKINSHAFLPWNFRVSSLFDRVPCMPTMFPRAFVALYACIFHDSQFWGVLVRAPQYVTSLLTATCLPWLPTYSSHPRNRSHYSLFLRK